jgi:MscS family membrane protein
MWFHPTLRLRRDTTPDQVREMMAALTKILEEHPMVDAAGVPLRFTKIGDQAFDLEIFAYVNSGDYNDFLKVQTELLLKFLEASIKSGVEFAVPLNAQLNITSAANQQEVWNFRQDATLREERQPPN